MSTIVVVRRAGLAVLAADTLTKAGHSKDPAEYVANHQKSFRVGDSALATAGPTSMKAILQAHFAGLKRPPRLDSVAALVRTWSGVHAALKRGWFMITTEGSDAAFESTRSDVLVANPHGIFGVSSHRVVQEFTRFYAYGSGSEYAMGAMYAAWADPALGAEAIARLGVEAAAEFDGATGLPLTVEVVRLAGAGRQRPPRKRG
jgi:ATP-dependent protease HslVU (ClpYQ) peptidase subunit